jgi:hypothetical protein
MDIAGRLTISSSVITCLKYVRMNIRHNPSRKDSPMKMKKYILIITIVLTIGFSYAWTALACDGGGRPPNTDSIHIESPAV